MAGDSETGMMIMKMDEGLDTGPVALAEPIAIGPNETTGELHDRLMAPLYPIAFVIIAYAYLGAPRTTRQSRTLSMLGAIGGVALLRLIGFASTVFGATIPWMLALPYLALATAIGAGLYVIRRGLIIEPPAFISDWLAALTERLGRRFVTP